MRERASNGGGAVGVLCALPQELGPLAGEVAGAAQPEPTRWAGSELGSRRIAGCEVLTCVAGVGKARAAQGAAALIAAGADRALLVVGVCGGLSKGMEPGQLVHCVRTLQTDFAVRHDREFEPDPELLSAWRAEVGGPEAWFLTADRPVMSLWRRVRLARAFRAPCVADMETAAAAAVASSAGVPWAALRAVTDRATGAGFLAFKRNFPAQAFRAAASIEALLGRLA